MAAINCFSLRFESRKTNWRFALSRPRVSIAAGNGKDFETYFWKPFGMSLIAPFAGLRPARNHAADVLAPPYDVLNSDEARARAEGRPWSFLHISKAEIDLPQGTQAYDDAVYAKAAANLKAMLAADVLCRDPAPCYYIYRLRMGDHEQTGIALAASVDAYDAGRIRRHEFTRPAKENDRVRQIEALDAQTGPVLLAHAPSSAITALLAKLCEQAPEYDLVADDGIAHALWVVQDPANIAAITEAFEAMPALYIADGHHRSAAASRVAAAKRAAHPDDKGDAPYNYFLAVAFPSDTLQVLDYNRVVRDLNGHGKAAFLTRVEEAFSVEESAETVSPARPGEFGMYLEGQWYRLAIRQALVPADPVARLDVSLLADHLIAPVLGIEDPRTDDRIDFVGGIRGLQELSRRVDSGEMAVAFSLHPTGLDDLMAVADAGQVMPPKSTWFEPKLADGLISHMLS